VTHDESPSEHWVTVCVNILSSLLSGLIRKTLPLFGRPAIHYTDFKTASLAAKCRSIQDRRAYNTVSAATGHLMQAGRVGHGSGGIVKAPAEAVYGFATVMRQSFQEKKALYSVGLF